jgi:nitrile hydratase accessory protein
VVLASGETLRADHVVMALGHSARDSFAMLHARGVFTWPQWAEALAQEIRRARDQGDTDDGTTYYHHWLQTLEQFVVQAGIGTPEQIHALEHAWEAAAARTPHGQAITLGASDTERL